MRVNSFSVSLALLAYLVIFIYATTALGGNGGPVPVSDGPTVRKDERWTLVSSEFGEISAVKIRDGENGCYYLHFITMNPRSLFLPVYLHSEMVLYVNSGSGTLSWIGGEKDGDKLQQVMLKRGDIFRLGTQSVFYLENNVETYEYQPQNLQIYAIFPGTNTVLQNGQLVAAYTGVHDLVLGFDNQVLQSTFSVPEEVIEELREGEKQPLIVEGQSEDKYIGIFNVQHKMKVYNFFKESHDVDTCFGWSVTVTSKQLDVLKNTNFGVFMANLTKGSMMAPHWNPNTVEIAIVLHGQGVIEVACPGVVSEIECKNSRLRVEEGDVFVVPRGYPMAQISFNNDSFVFIGFMTKLKNESPQYLLGNSSILKKLDRNVLGKSFNVRNTTIDWVLSNDKEDIIYECVSCAEEEVTRRSKEGRGKGGDSQEEERGWQGEKEGGGGGWQEEGGRGQRQEDKGGRGGWQKQEGGMGGGGGWQEEGGGRGWQEM